MNIFGFFGVEVQPNIIAKTQPPEETVLHLTQAALAAPVHKTTRLFIRVISNEDEGSAEKEDTKSQKYAITTFIPGVMESQSLKVKVGLGDAIEFSSEGGQASIHVTGYYTWDGEGEEEDEVEDTEDGERMGDVEEEGEYVVVDDGQGMHNFFQQVEEDGEDGEYVVEEEYMEGEYEEDYGEDDEDDEDDEAEDVDLDDEEKEWLATVNEDETLPAPEYKFEGESSDESDDDEPMTHHAKPVKGNKKKKNTPTKKQKTATTPSPAGKKRHRSPNNKKNLQDKRNRKKKRH